MQKKYQYNNQHQRRLRYEDMQHKSEKPKLFWIKGLLVFTLVSFTTIFLLQIFSLDTQDSQAYEKDKYELGGSILTKQEYKDIKKELVKSAKENKTKPMNINDTKNLVEMVNSEQLYHYLQDITTNNVLEKLGVALEQCNQ